MADITTLLLRGFSRSIDNFKTAVVVYCGELDLDPRSCRMDDQIHLLGMDILIYFQQPICTLPASNGPIKGYIDQ